MKNYIFPDYFEKELTINYFKDMYTRKKVYELLYNYTIETNKKYDYIIILNPGQLIASQIPNITTWKKTEIYLPNNNHCGGYFGRFAVGDIESICAYTSLFDYIVENKDNPPYMSNGYQDKFNKYGNVNIHPECSVKYILNKYGYFPIEKGYTFDLELKRVRSNGDII